MPKSNIQVRAVRPERDDCEIRFPRVASYRIELPKDRLEVHESAGGAVIALLDPSAPIGTTGDINFTTSKTKRWRTRADRCHVNWAVGDSDWELELCQVAEANPDVLAYVKNFGMGFEVPYRNGGQRSVYSPDFILKVRDDDDEGEPLHLVVDVKVFHGEEAKHKATAMRNYWLPGVNRLGAFGYWQFAELRNNWDFEKDLRTAIDQLRREALAFRDGHQGLNNRNAVLTALRQLKPRLQQEFGIESLKLFGSFARDEAHLTSDIDLLVEYRTEPTNWGNFGEGPFLEDTLGRKVDIAVGTNLRDHVRPNAEREAIDV